MSLREMESMRKLKEANQKRKKQKMAQIIIPKEPEMQILGSNSPTFQMKKQNEIETQTYLVDKKPA